jgi:hypothetical protein
MPGAVLHVLGESFDPRPFLADASLRPYRAFLRGERRFPESRKNLDTFGEGGFSCEVSGSDGVLAEEVADALAFLVRHRGDLERLAGEPGARLKRLDFGYYARLGGPEGIMVQEEVLPPELLGLAGGLGIEVMLSLYAASEMPGSDDRAGPQ